MLRRSESRGVLGKGVGQHEATTSVRRVGQPEDIAAACAFLARADAGYITGQVIARNCGRTT
ncbi:SDR family oxidoreductase [Frankia nepalensis]|uniref:SDR family oxidoreductase n=1 Tax=Frankia nepalensis TaxID=1836974 RepID=UPI00396A2621